MSNNAATNGVAKKKVMYDAMAESQVSRVMEKVRGHLDQKNLACPLETEGELKRFLGSNLGLKKVDVRQRRWTNQNETDFFMEFSFDGTIVEHQKITRKNLIYQIMTSA